MKLKIEKKVLHEVELELPYYFKLTYGSAGDIHYAIVTESKSISVNGNEIFSLSTSTVCGHLEDNNFFETNAGEFIIAFDKAVESLKKLVKPRLSYSPVQNQVR